MLGMFKQKKMSRIIIWSKMWKMLSFKNVKKIKHFENVELVKKLVKQVKNLANGQKILTMLRKAKVF